MDQRKNFPALFDERKDEETLRLMLLGFLLSMLEAKGIHKKPEKCLVK